MPHIFLARPRHPRCRSAQWVAPCALVVAPCLQNPPPSGNSHRPPPSSTDLHSSAQPLSRSLPARQNFRPAKESTTPLAFPLPIPPPPEPPRSMPGAMPSIDAPIQTGSIARATAAPTNHPATQIVRCGTAPGEFQRGRADRRAETRLPARFASLVLREAAPHKKRTPPDAHRSVRAPAAPLHRKHKTPAEERSPCSAATRSRSSQPAQLCAQFARSPKQRILHRLFSRSQRLAYRTQLQSLIMLHLKHNPFPWRQPLHRRRNPRLNFFAEQPPLRVQRRPMLPLPLKKVGDPLIRVPGMRFRSLIFRPRLPPPQMIQAHVRDNPIQPGVEAALKAEAMQVAVDLQESFLVNVARVLGTLHQIQRQPQHVAVVPAHQFLKRSSVSNLRFRDYTALVQLGQ